MFTKARKGRPVSRARSQSASFATLPAPPWSPNAAPETMLLRPPMSDSRLSAKPRSRPVARSESQGLL